MEQELKKIQYKKGDFVTFKFQDSDAIPLGVLSFYDTEFVEEYFYPISNYLTLDYPIVSVVQFYDEKVYSKLYELDLLVRNHERLTYISLPTDKLGSIVRPAGFTRSTIFKDSFEEQYILVSVNPVSESRSFSNMGKDPLTITIKNLRTSKGKTISYEELNTKYTVWKR